MSQPIAVDPPLVTRTALGLYRVEASIGGTPVWIESAQPLRASAEAFVAVSLLPAMAAHRPLAVAAALDPAFAANLGRIQEQGVAWWPALSRVSVTPAGFCAAEPGAGAAMFFTAGADSFFTLKRNRRDVERLINVRGFDIALSDADRQRENTALIDGIGRELGKPIIYLDTNLRQHGVFGSVNWEITHIAAIACMAHSLSPAPSTVYIASTDIPPPWGSHQDIDPLWSSSGLSIVNDGWELSRLDKVRHLVGWEIVHRSLKVCWENRARTLNCGICEKCVRTQAEFLAAGAESPPATFPAGDLSRRIEDLPALSPHLCKQWRDVQTALPVGGIAVAIGALLRRSEKAPA
jgi:hypothetical protein